MLEYIVTPLGEWKFKLEARLSADHPFTRPVRLAKRFVGGRHGHGGAQSWKVTDGHGSCVQGPDDHPLLMGPGQTPPDRDWKVCPADWIVVEPGATVEVDPCCDLKHAFSASGWYATTWTYESTPHSLLEGAQEVAGSCTWSPETEERADGSAGGIHTMAVSEATAAGFND